MKCINCGAVLDVDNLVCAYCGTVNNDAVKRKQELDKLEKENLELKKEVLSKSKEEVCYKIHKRVNIVLVVLFVLVTILSFAMYVIVEGDILNKKGNVSDMIHYYESGDYENLYFCMSDGNLFSPEEYPDYSHMALLWNQYNQCQNYYAQAYEKYQKTGQYDDYSLEQCIKKGCCVLTGDISHIYSVLSEENKKRIKPYQEQVIILFSGALQIPDEMIAEIYDKVQYEQADALIEYVLEVLPNE